MAEMKNNIEWSYLNKKFRLAQRNDKFKFGTDAVLLSYFAAIKSYHNVVDLCSGTGAVGFLSFLRYNTLNTVFVDIDEDMTRLSELTAEENSLSSRFSHITCDINELNNGIIKNHWADYITVNPPYFNKNCGKENKIPDLEKARRCDENFLNILFAKSFAILKDGGKIAVVHRSEYLSDIFFYMKSNCIEPKRIRLVHSYAEKNALLVLVEGMKNASVSVICESPLVLYKNRGEYTEEYKKIQEI